MTRGSGRSSRARRRDKQGSREALIRAAAELFREQGLDGPSLRAICARAGYTRGVFYVHFESREDLLVAVLEWVLEAFIDDVLASAEGPTDAIGMTERFTRRLRALPVSADPSPGEECHPLDFLALHRVIEASMRSPRVHQGFVRSVATALERVRAAASASQAAGQIRHDLAATEVAQLLTLIGLGAIVTSDLELPIDLEALRQQLLRLLAPPGSLESSADPA